MEKFFINISKILDRYIFKGKIPILIYHRVNNLPRHIDPDIDIPTFTKQIKILSERGYYFASMEEIIFWAKGAKRLPEKSIVLTFDDGYEDSYLNVFPIIKKYNVKITIYLIADFIGEKRFYSENRKVPQKIFEENYNPATDRISSYLTKSQILEMSKSGLVDFGAHTKTHPDLRSLFVDFLENEITGSKKKLEDGLELPVNTFCYPYGEYNETIVKIVKKAGFLGAVTTQRGKVRQGDNVFELPRWNDRNAFVNMPPVIRKMGKLF